MVYMLFKLSTNFLTVPRMLNIIFKNRNNKVIFESFMFYIICNMLHAHDYLIITYPVKTEETPRNY